jgi:hypothetical protein
MDTGPLHFSPVAAGNGVLYSADSPGFLTAREAATGTILGKLPLGGPTFGGISVAGRAVYVAVGIGPPSPAQPVPGVDTSQMDGSGAIVAFGDTSGTTFDGTCQLSGKVRFTPALTGAPQNGKVAGTLAGTCSGTLTDARGRSRSLSDARVGSIVHSQGLESCGAGRGSGAGYLSFGSRRLRFTYDEVRTGPALTLQVTGARGGSAAAQGNVSPSADPVATLQACGAAGLTEAPVDARVATTSPMSG